MGIHHFANTAATMGSSGPWLKPGPAVAAAAFGKMNQQMQALPSLLSFLFVTLLKREYVHIMKYYSGIKRTEPYLMQQNG